MEYIKEFEINEIHTELENYLEVLQESYKNKKSSMFNNNKKKAQNITKAQKALFKLYNTELTTEEQEAIKAKNEMDEIFRKIKYFEKDTSKIDKIKTSLSKERSQNIQNISKTIEKLENEINKYLKNIPIDKPITISKTETIDGKRIKININTKAQEIKSNTNNIYKHHSEDYYAIEFEKNGIYVQDKFSNALNKLISIKKKEYNQTIYADSDLKSIKKIETQKKNKELMIKIEKLLKEQKIDKESGITYNQINEINKQIEKLEEIDNKIILLEQAETLCRNNNKIYPNSLSKIVDLKKDYLKEQKEINNQLENLKIEDIEKIVTEKEEQELKDNEAKIEKQAIIQAAKKLESLKNNPNISKEEALKEEKKILEDIRFLPSLDADQKEEALKEGKEIYKREEEEKKLQLEIMKKERQEKEKTEAEAQAYLREAAIKSLEAKGLLEDLKVYNGDTHDAMTPERQEKLIEEEMKKLAEPSKQSKEEIALQALKKLGYISPEKTINDLKPYERDALLAQMRITNEETSNKKR